ncbi:hypothetical protein CDES_10385 [Corynebacterium deserti GIMN1.010]|uniref:Secreted protein n=1 Tax=Corynebacterium deserti GIMN1.010 TaxID=931089 RepID=A0A0M4CET5_9CORY|nr:hypothetical protein [Corynebacterium deserti]ALC06454.1 hypothetical protein CDES_10385 [Corynebacterium deserti GIMN1.010]
MKQRLVAAALASALTLSAIHSPALATVTHSVSVSHAVSDQPSTVAESVASDPGHTATQSDAPDLWPNAVAKPGDIVRIPYLGHETVKCLTVEATEPFQDFKTLVERDNSIVVAVPNNLSGVSKVSPVFTVSDEDGELDTFSIDVEVDPAGDTAEEKRSALFEIISEIAYRMPHLPFVAELLKY